MPQPASVYLRGDSPTPGPSRKREGRDVRSAIRDGARLLACVSDTPRLDAELLTAYALGCEREAMLLDALDARAPEGFDALLARRLEHEPIAYIIGSREFWSLDFAVGPGVLIPRPDSETLIEAALAACAKPPASILDLGTGPGTLLLAALSEWPDAIGVGVDRSETALGYARRNAAVFGLSDRARFVVGDWAAALGGRFDLVLCNPPYIAEDEELPETVSRHEPAGALFAGADGLDAYRALAPQIADLLLPEGIACIEIGASQAVAVARLFAGKGLQSRCFKDLGGRDRCLVIHNSA